MPYDFHPFEYLSDRWNEYFSRNFNAQTSYLLTKIDQLSNELAMERRNSAHTSHSITENDQLREDLKAEREKNNLNTKTNLDLCNRLAETEKNYKIKLDNKLVEEQQRKKALSDEVAQLHMEKAAWIIKFAKLKAEFDDQIVASTKLAENLSKEQQKSYNLRIIASSLVVGLHKEQTKRVEQEKAAVQLKRKVKKLNNKIIQLKTALEDQVPRDWVQIMMRWICETISG